VQALLYLLPRVRVWQSPEQPVCSVVEKNTAINKRTTSKIYQNIILMIFRAGESKKKTVETIQDVDVS